MDGGAGGSDAASGGSTSGGSAGSDSGTVGGAGGTADAAGTGAIAGSAGAASGGTAATDAGGSVQCAGYLLGMNGAACVALAPGLVSDPLQCPKVAGATIVECDAACLKTTNNNCVYLAPVSAVTVSGVCDTSGTPCQPLCSGGVTSFRACNGTGKCSVSGTEDCSPYTCKGTICGYDCSSSIQCQPPYACSGTTCVMP